MPEDFGPGLRRTQFNDVVLLLFEDVAGLEVMPQQQTDEHLRSLWVVYRRLAASNRFH